MQGCTWHQILSARLLACSAAILYLIVASAFAPAPAAGATTQPAYIDTRTQHDSLVADLQSGNAARVTSALTGIQAYLVRYGDPVRYADPAAELRALQILLDAKRYPELDAMALAQILKGPANTKSLAKLEKLRTQAFLAAGDPASALSTAKAYYAVASLKDTADAIDLVALCLAAVHPDDPAIVQRFKQQQIAWASAAPTSQPDAAAGDNAPANPGLGDPVLPAIPVDAKPFDDAIAAIALNDYSQFLAKGNLLLLAGRAAEAHEVFSKAVLIAPSAKEGEAYEAVARAIRAESGYLAPANAYILTLRGAK